MHALDPLLRPRSVAVIGASSRTDSMGEWALINLERGGFNGTIYAVNPGYDAVRGLKCYPSVAALPATPDLVIFCIGDARIEEAMDEAILAGVPAAVLMSSLHLDHDRTPALKERIRAKTRRAGMLVCGANGMGFYNVRDGVWACGFDSTLHEAPGNACLISQSGSGMSGLIDCDERLRINLAVSTGNELGVTMDQYLDFALDLPETRVVGLFIETARNPAAFRAALEKARHKKIPLVALKVGRTKRSAELAKSHSGAMAGDDVTYDALFEHYGVHRVRDMDELATAMILNAELAPPGPGGLVALHDSGGERQLLIDLADEEAVPLTELAPETVNALAAVLEPELPAVNPLDGWSRGGEGAGDRMAECLSILMQDPGCAVGALVHDRAPGGGIYGSYNRYLERAQEASGKPVVLVAARQGTGRDPLVVENSRRGFPVLDGVIPFLRGIRGLLKYRDFKARPRSEPAPVPAAAVRKWQDVLRGGHVLDEAESLKMFADFGMSVSDAVVVESQRELLSAADAGDWPLVLKTAMPGITHKTDVGGVATGIRDREELLAAYDEMKSRHGTRVLLAPMLSGGVEMMLGCRNDPQFGPVVLIGFGGVLAETLGDVIAALPPLGEADVMRRLDELKLAPLLHGVRGRPAVDINAFCRMCAQFAAMAEALAGVVQEIDVNPVIVSSSGAVAVDGLVVARGDAGELTSDN